MNILVWIWLGQTWQPGARCGCVGEQGMEMGGSGPQAVIAAGPGSPVRSWNSAESSLGYRLQGQEGSWVPAPHSRRQRGAGEGVIGGIPIQGVDRLSRSIWDGTDGVGAGGIPSGWLVAMGWPSCPAEAASRSHHILGGSSGIRHPATPIDTGLDGEGLCWC